MVGVRRILWLYQLSLWSCIFAELWVDFHLLVLPGILQGYEWDTHMTSLLIKFFGNRMFIFIKGFSSLSIVGN